MIKKLVPLVGLIVLAGPVLAVAAPASTTPAASTSQTAKSKTHKHAHSHPKKAAKTSKTST